MPELDDLGGLATRAWHDLSADRAIGFGLGSIPFTAMDAWARRYGIMDADLFDALRAAIRVIDAEWLKRQSPSED